MYKSIVTRMVSNNIYVTKDHPYVGFTPGQGPKVGDEVEYQDHERYSRPQHVKTLYVPHVIKLETELPAEKPFGYSGPNSIETSVPVIKCDSGPIEGVVKGFTDDSYLVEVECYGDAGVGQTVKFQEVPYEKLMKKKEKRMSKGIVTSVDNSGYIVDNSNVWIGQWYGKSAMPAVGDEVEFQDKKGFTYPQHVRVITKTKKTPLKDWWIIRMASWVAAIGSLATVLWSVA